MQRKAILADTWPPGNHRSEYAVDVITEPMSVRLGMGKLVCFAGCVGNVS